jgi:hypothetical protein
MKSQGEKLVPNTVAVAPDRVRTTIIIPRALDANLEVLRLSSGVSKNEMIIRALTYYLTEQGLEPGKSPVINVTY